VPHAGSEMACPGSGRTHRPSNGVTINDAVGLHLVDRSDDRFDVHIQNLSGNRNLVQFIEQFGQLFAEELMRFHLR